MFKDWGEPINHGSTLQLHIIAYSNSVQCTELLVSSTKSPAYPSTINLSCVLKNVGRYQASCLVRRCVDQQVYPESVCIIRGSLTSAFHFQDSTSRRRRRPSAPCEHQAESFAKPRVSTWVKNRVGTPRAGAANSLAL